MSCDDVCFEQKTVMGFTAILPSILCCVFLYFCVRRVQMMFSIPRSVPILSDDMCFKHKTVMGLPLVFLYIFVSVVSNSR